jgi:hypothetical protein
VVTGRLAVQVRNRFPPKSQNSAVTPSYPDADSHG